MFGKKGRRDVFYVSSSQSDSASDSASDSKMIGDLCLCMSLNCSGPNVSSYCISNCVHLSTSG